MKLKRISGAFFEIQTGPVNNLNRRLYDTTVKARKHYDVYYVCLNHSLPCGMTVSDRVHAAYDTRGDFKCN